MKMFDSHSHLSFYEFSRARQIILRALGEGIQSHVAGGYDSRDWKNQFSLKQEFPDRFFTCVGVHPWRVIDLSEEELSYQWDQFEEFALLADFIGELGLDGHVTQDSRLLGLQKVWFKKQLSFASGHSKPIVIHSVKAYEPTLELLSEERSSEWRGFVHGFSGGPEMAQKFIDLGLLISVGAGVLNPKFIKLQRTLKEMPLEAFIFESDQPSNRGSDNYDFQLLSQILGYVGKIKNKTSLEVAEVAQDNFQRVLGRQKF